MTEVYISLYGEKAEWFEEEKEKVEAARDGTEISNVEMVCRLLEQYDAPCGNRSETTADPLGSRP
jgi:hypothetical protein